MDMMDFINTLDRLDKSRNVFFRKGSFTIIDRKDDNYNELVIINLNMQREDFLAISGGILSLAKNVQLESFKTTDDRGLEVSASADIDLDGKFIEAASYIAKILEQHDLRANLTINLNAGRLAISDVSYKNLAIEVSDFLYSFYDSADCIATIPFRYLTINVDPNKVYIYMEESSN